jgi:hypothetical protein
MLRGRYGADRHELSTRRRLKCFEYDSMPLNTECPSISTLLFILQHSITDYVRPGQSKTFTAPGNSKQ